jgi:hypothetical protein
LAGAVGVARSARRGVIVAPAGAGWFASTGEPVPVWPEESPSAFLPSAAAVRALVAVVPGGGDSVAAADPSAVAKASDGGSSPRFGGAWAGAAVTATAFTESFMCCFL